MKKPFSDPLAIKNQKPPYKPMDGKNSPWDFRTPPYDQRHSCFIQAGTDYGTGVAQPSGHKGKPKDIVDSLPFNTVKTVDISEKY